MGDLDIASISTVAAFILIAIGFFSIFLPVAPSIPLIWFGIFVYAISHGYTQITRSFMAGVSLIAVGTIFLDYTLYKFGIRKFRAGAWEVVGALIGFVAGSFLSPLASIVIGPIVGAVVFGALRGNDQVYSFKTGNTTVVAFMGGTIVKLAAALAMVGLFILRLQGKL